MITDNISKTLKMIARKHLNLINDNSELPVDTKLLDLGLDSMGSINLLLDIEETFEVVIPDDLLTSETFRTISTLDHAIRSLIDPSK